MGSQGPTLPRINNQFLVDFCFDREFPKWKEAPMALDRIGELIIAKKSPSSTLHAIRTAVAVVASLLTAHLFRLSEAYWAGISTSLSRNRRLGPPCLSQHNGSPEQSWVHWWEEWSGCISQATFLFSVCWYLRSAFCARPSEWSALRIGTPALRWQS